MNNKAVKLGLPLALSCLILVLAACRGVAVDNQMGVVNVKQTLTAIAKPMETANVKRDMVARVTADGCLAFVEHRRLTFGTSGTVDKINVNELDKVTKGQVLAKLDTISLERVVKTAELGAKTAELALKSVEFDRKQGEYGIKSAEADLKTVQANLKAAGIDLEQAKDNFRKIAYPYSYHTVTLDVPEALGFMNDASREITNAVTAIQTGLSAYEVSSKLQQALDSLTKSRELLRRGYGTDVFGSEILPMKDFWTMRAAQLEADKAQLAVENAGNMVNKTALAVENAKTTLSKAQLAEDKAKHDVDRAKNELDRAKYELEKAVIVAPFDGVIAKVNIKMGDTLTAMDYAKPAIELVDPGRMELALKVNEMDITNVKLGQKVATSVYALPDEQFEGVVSSISLLPDAAAGAVSYEVKTVFGVSQNLALKAGMGATADIIIEKRS